MTNTDQSAAEEKSNSNPSRRAFPFRVILTVVFSVAVVAAVRLYEPLVGYIPEGTAGDIVLLLTDHAHVNILTYIFSFIAIITPIIWFARKSTSALPVRLFPLAVLIVVMIGTPVFCEIRVNGELWPTFTPRWLVGVEPLPEAVDRVVDLAMTTPDDFPQFLGPNRNGVLAGNSINPNWESSPPKQVWRQTIGAGWSAFSVVHGFAVTMEQRGEDEFVTCYEVETGKLRWSQATKTRHDNAMGGLGPRSTPTIHEGKVYTLGATGMFHCLDGKDGKVIWKKNLLDEFNVASPKDDEKEIAWGRAASPLIVDDLVVVPAGGPSPDQSVSLVAYNRTSGEEIWRGGTTQISYSSPILTTISGIRQIVSVNEDKVSGHDPKSGKTLWTFPWPGSSSAGANVSQPVPISGDRLLISKGYGQGAALLQFDDKGEPSQVWHKKTVLKTKFTNVVVRDGYVYGLSDGILECVDVESGRKKWKRGRYGQGQIMLIGDTILIQAESGDVVLVKASPDGHQELSRLNAIRGTTWNNPTLSGNHLLVRNGLEAACYEISVERE